jgi:hypothetical protein
MKGVLATAAVAASVLALSFLATESNAEEAAGGTPPLSLSQVNCGIGPVAKSYRGTPWLVYGCDDGRSIRMVAASGSLLEGCVITLQYDNGLYHRKLDHAGGSNTHVIAAALRAFSEVAALSASYIETLFAETKLASAA